MPYALVGLDRWHPYGRFGFAPSPEAQEEPNFALKLPRFRGHTIPALDVAGLELPDEITTQVMGVGPHHDVNYLLDLDGDVAGTKTNAAGG